jgi:hypothetical protein
MKTILILCGLILAGLAAWLVASRNGSQANHHGTPFKNLPAVSLAELTGKPGDHVRKPVRIEGTLARQCPSRGCWFYLRDTEGHQLKVEMGDTTPDLPPRVGKTAIVEGQLIPFGEGHEFIGTAVEFRP